MTLNENYRPNIGFNKLREENGSTKIVYTLQNKIKYFAKNLRIKALSEEYKLQNVLRGTYYLMAYNIFGVRPCIKYILEQ